MNNKLSKQLYVDNWPRRRKWMITVLLWAIAMVTYLTIFAIPTSVVEVAVMSLIGLIAAIIGSYVFGAVWDDNDKRRHHRIRGSESPDGSEDYPE